MLKSTPSRSHRSAARTTSILFLVVVVIGGLAGGAYALLHDSGSPRTGATPSASVSSAAAPTSASPTPAASALPSDVVRFVALPVGTPPSPGSPETGYPWHALTAALVGPAKVQAGSVTDYRVTLTNRTAAPIALDPCPAYDLRVGLRDFSYGLNCTDAPSGTIAPGESLTFDLPVPIPRSLSGASTDIVWSLGWQPDKKSPRAQRTVAVT